MIGSRRIQYGALLAFVLSLTAQRPARAQHCHSDLRAPVETHVVAAGASFEAASFDADGRDGSWLGARPQLDVRWGFMAARAWVPFFRLTSNSESASGLGDVGGELRARMWRSSGGDVSAGPMLAATAATGDAGAGLGMGHPMATVGAWWSAAAGQVVASGAFGYSRAVKPSGHLHAHAARSLVEPMNSSEATAIVSAGWAIGAVIRPELGFAFAEPVQAEQGRRRGWTSLGATFVSIVDVDINLAVQIPVVGDPFRVRTSLNATLRL